SGLAAQLTRGRFSGADDRQAEQAVGRVVEEAVAARLALARVRANIASGGRRHATEAHAGEMQIAPVATDQYRVAAQRLDAVHAVPEDDLGRDLGTGVTHGESARVVDPLRPPPAGARSVEEIVPDEAVLQRIARNARQATVAAARRAVAAIGEAGEWH